jgi:molybdopterin converting factor small subunit
MNVLLFGMIAEKAGADQLSVEASSTGELRRSLASCISGLDQLSYAIAVDRRIVHQDVPLTGSEEIAVLPPFAGG